MRNHRPEELLRGALLGIEKESLRVTPEGVISQTDHPKGLGSALMHPAVTTDYSEALIEFVTSPHEQIADVVRELDELHRWVYGNLGEELFWVTSMPCILAGEQSIRIADYGSSNQGMMKTVYRRGLGVRYGRMMQVIAGVHFNYSFSEPMLHKLHELFGDGRDFASFKSESYMGMLRNLLRIGWVVPYLFGASPAICESFLEGEPTTLEYLGHGTYYEAFATSLRMGDIGYQNSREGETGVDIDFGSLGRYVESLDAAININCPHYEALGLMSDGEFQQLNANRLQIENEYYCTVRPKTLLQGLEKPVRAMQARGIDYIELRSVDLNPFEPLGVSEQQLYFLEALMVYAMLLPSPEFADGEKKRVADNLALVAHCGRDPALELSRGDEKVGLRRWSTELLESLREICQWLDEKSPDGHAYSDALSHQIAKNSDAAELPSSKLMQLLKERDESFHQFAIRKANLVAKHFQSRPLPADRLAYYDNLAQRSVTMQKALEAEEQQPFTDFLAEYFRQ